MSIKVGICDDDRLYMQRLMAYVNDAREHGESGYTFYGYTSARQLMESVQQHEIDIALVAGKYRSLFAQVELPVCFLLDERGGDGVFKYSRADLILSELRNRTYKEPPAVTAGGIRVTGVYSPLGRSGKTRLAKGMCRCIDNSLYIAFGDYQKPGSEEEMLLCDRLLFMIAARDESFYSLIGPGARELLAGAEHMELRQLSAEDVTFMLSVIREHGDYRQVVIDIGTGAMSDLRVLLACDMILVPTIRDDYAYERLDVFKKQLSYGPLSALNLKIRYVEVPGDDSILESRIRREFL